MCKVASIGPSKVRGSGSHAAGNRNIAKLRMAYETLQHKLLKSAAHNTFLRGIRLADMFASSRRAVAIFPNGMSKMLQPKAVFALNTEQAGPKLQFQSRPISREAFVQHDAGLLTPHGRRRNTFSNSD
jgi:hypothetical protein